MRYKEAMPPSKKMQKPAKRVAQRKYDEDKEEFDQKVKRKENGFKKPAGIQSALNKDKEGYDKKPRVKPSKKR